MHFVCALCVCFLLIAAATAAPGSDEANAPDPDDSVAQPPANSAAGTQSEIDALKRQLARQQKQIEELQVTLQKQAKAREDNGATAGAAAQPTAASGSRIAGEVASMVPMIPSTLSSVSPSTAVSMTSPNTTSQGAAPKSEVPAWVKGFKPIGTFYISYADQTTDSGINQTTSSNSFTLKRGYFGADVDVTSYLTSRFVGDVTLDSTGDVKVRAKYLYGKFHAKGNNTFTGPYMEFGLAHMPWLDFEEAINGFRMQDTMFTERNNIFNSADFGVIAGSDLGGSMDSDYKSKVNSHYAGRYGSWQMGVYNGTGYHAAEANKNKVFEARLSFRPGPSVIPGLQVTAFGAVGKGNKAATTLADSPKWQSGIAMISYESQYFTFTGQGYLGIGNQGGSAIESNGSAAHQKGFSVFASVHIPTPHFGEKVSLIGRVDEFNSNTRVYNDLQRRYIAGFAWHMYKNDIWLIDYQRTNHSLGTLAGEDRVQLTLQMAY
jgi:hypothetical protein